MQHPPTASVYLTSPPSIIKKVKNVRASGFPILHDPFYCYCLLYAKIFPIFYFWMNWELAYRIVGGMRKEGGLAIISRAIARESGWGR